MKMYQTVELPEWPPRVCRVLWCDVRESVFMAHVAARTTLGLVEGLGFLMPMKGPGYHGYNLNFTRLPSANLVRIRQELWEDKRGL